MGTGDRSEKIRTYNFPASRVSDHRSGLTLYTLEEVMQGDLDEFVDAMVQQVQMGRMQQWIDSED